MDASIRRHMILTLRGTDRLRLGHQWRITKDD